MNHKHSPDIIDATFVDMVADALDGGLLVVEPQDNGTVLVSDGYRIVQSGRRHGPKSADGLRKTWDALRADRELESLTVTGWVYEMHGSFPVRLFLTQSGQRIWLQTRFLEPFGSNVSELSSYGWWGKGPDKAVIVYWEDQMAIFMPCRGEQIEQTPPIPADSEIKGLT